MEVEMVRVVSTANLGSLREHYYDPHVDGVVYDYEEDADTVTTERRTQLRPAPVREYVPPTPVDLGEALPAAEW